MSSRNLQYQLHGSEKNYSSLTCIQPDTQYFQLNKTSNVKQSCYRPEQALRVDRGIALPFRDLGARRGCVVSITSWLLYPRERPSTHCTGGWVGPRAGLDMCKKSRLHRDSIPRPSSP
jgi:hypothetical protein